MMCFGGKNMENNAKEPLYKKWWAWVGLFILVATLINSHEEATLSSTIENDYIYDDSGDNRTRFDEYVYDDGYDERPTVDAHEMTDEYDDDSAAAIPLCCTQTNNVFLVGQDLAPGEYFIQAKEDTHAFVQVARDNSGAVGSVITNKIFQTHSFITVHEGEYLVVERGIIMNADEASVPSFTNGVLGDGVYRVGIDIPAGQYTVLPTSDVAGYYQIATNSRGTASDIVSNNNFSDEITINVEVGQYLTLTRAQLKK